jgi:hypothetical protein
VFGCERDELAEVSDQALKAAGMLAADAVESVSPAKRLADELEELEAVRGAVGIDVAEVAETMRVLGFIAAEALSCELAAIYLADGEQVELIDRGWTLEASSDTVAAALRTAFTDGRFPYVVQDACVVPLASPLDAEHGVRSYYLLELTGIARGLIFVAHTDAAPRGLHAALPAARPTARGGRVGAAGCRAHAGVVLRRGGSPPRGVRKARRRRMSPSTAGAVKRAITSNHT